MDIERSDGLLYIQITLKSGRTQAQKTSFYAELAEQLASTAGIRPQDVFVVLVGSEYEDWTFGNGVAQMLSRPAGKNSPREIRSTARESFGDIAPGFVRYTEELLFGEVWQREQLGKRDRSLVTVAALVASGLTEQLPFHLQLARENGLTQEELIEALTHLAFYTGWPRAASALQVARQTVQP